MPGEMDKEEVNLPAKKGTKTEMRQDPTTEEWVIIASDRAKRPHELVKKHQSSPLPDYSPTCPFCPGNEHLTPPEILSYEDPGTGCWRVRVVANKFPALSPTGTTKKREEDGFFRKMDGVGMHEIIVETPRHDEPLALMDVGDIELVLRAYRERYNAICSVASVRAIVIFKNHGPSAGTSLIHSHSQLIATPVIPRMMRIRRDVAAEYFESTGHCLYRDLAEHEGEVGTRILYETGRFTVFHPFASKRPFETWIVPKFRQASFGSATDQDLAHLAGILKTALGALHAGLNDPDYNYVIYSAPIGEEDVKYFLWHLRIIPRVTTMAGFEIGSGICINPAVPEDTAGYIRDLSERVRTESINVPAQMSGCNRTGR
jgi:UDPglucose--hexose-1-phosphate uridylyltransferase